jgi:hypothetical protein
VITYVQSEVAKVALRQMHEGGHFSICVVDKILKMTGGTPQRADYEALSLLHCVNFKDFTPMLRLEYPKLLQRVLESPSMHVEINFQANACHEIPSNKQISES